MCVVRAVRGEEGVASWLSQQGRKDGEMGLGPKGDGYAPGLNCIGGQVDL